MDPAEAPCWHGSVPRAPASGARCWWSGLRRRWRSAWSRSWWQWCSTGSSGFRRRCAWWSCCRSLAEAWRGSSCACFPRSGSRRRSWRWRSGWSAATATHAASWPQAPTWRRLTRQPIRSPGSWRRKWCTAPRPWWGRPTRASSMHDRPGARRCRRGWRWSSSWRWCCFPPNPRGLRSFGLPRRLRMSSGRRGPWWNRRWLRRSIRAAAPCRSVHGRFVANRHRCASRRSTAWFATVPASGGRSSCPHSRMDRSSGSSRRTATRSRCCSAPRTWRRCR